ncbi:hypothetical protein NM208_g15449 [Fusarium decemcellulare]|uniref:Uncharacterized protein n=1 Tax=Fusarium decemcellulare TaxID=57161 RepID=A0ACC1REG9_9HYPO|nr:hypothetical protein NM208_g15449 [Fusarium decemcellulare]
MQLANKANQPQADIMERLKAIGQEEQRQSSQEPVTDIPMSPEEYNDTSAKLTKIVVDMGKIGRGLKKWYTITRDDARARMFFRTRWRILKQFSDGEKMSVPRETFSIRGSDIDQARAMLESMAKDLAASVYARNMGRPPSQQQGTPQTQNAQLAQQQQQQVPQQQQQPQQQQPQAQAQGGQPAPLNAENLRRNSQAQANSKGANKANQVPNAPVATQPPFQFGASSPHGNPSYVGKPKDINLQLPPSRKKQKTTGQTPQGATPSPQISKKSSPEMRRASESQAPAKPVILCKEPECEHSTVGFPSEQALQYHVQEEHTKPREDPKKFVQENLALALGLEPDGSMKKELKTEAVPMSMTNSKQGQTPATMAATPMSTDGAMKRSASSMGKLQDSKTGIKAGATPKLADAKAPDATGAMDPWANSTIDPQSLMSNLGLENGVGFNNFTDLTLYRSATPNDTPESAKDSGASEPNSDISEGVSLEIDFDWANLDTDLLLNMNNANLDGNMGPAGFGEASLDPAILLEPSGPPPDWDDIQTDFSKPFQFDTSHYFMATS